MKLRVARHTASLEPIIRFYCDMLGLEILGSFEDHNGYNGVFLGLKNAGGTSSLPPLHMHRSTSPTKTTCWCFISHQQPNMNLLNKSLVLITLLQ